MSKIRRLLFPFRQTFRRLELEKLWWHRLALVLFFVALISTFLFSWVIGNDASAPVHSLEQDIHHWSEGPNGLLLDFESFQPLDSTAPPTPPPPTVQKTIDMPDGKTATYPGTTSDDTIKFEWKHKLKLAEIQAVLLGFGIAVLMAVIFSYLLQTSYRVLLYVIYGANPHRT